MNTDDVKHRCGTCDWWSVPPEPQSQPGACSWRPYLGSCPPWVLHGGLMGRNEGEKCECWKARNPIAAAIGDFLAEKPKRVEGPKA